MRSFARDQDLVPVGQAPAGMWWIHAGVVRLYSLTAEGAAHVVDFAAAGEWTAAALQLSDGSACCAHAGLGIEALRPTRASELPMAWIESLQRHHAEVAVWMRRQWLLAGERRLARELALLRDTGTQRYQTFVAERPALAATLPLHQIAAWLGITPVALSRIRRQLRRDGGDRSDQSGMTPSTRR